MRKFKLNQKYQTKKKKKRKTVDRKLVLRRSHLPISNSGDSTYVKGVFKKKTQTY